MLNKNSKLERIWSGLGWGIFFILIGSLIFASNRGGLSGGEGWLYFVVGLGGIFIIGFLARFLANHSNRWSAYGGLVAGVCLVYIGAAFLYGFGDWWPLVFIPVGVGYTVKAIWRSKTESNTP
jgi:Kef-type K+ transport system membrane component KefB